MSRALGLATAGLLLGCSSASIRGGRAVADGGEPAGHVLARYGVRACHDSAGGAVQHDGEVLLVDVGNGHQILIAERPSCDSLVLHNARVENGERVFQAVLDDGDGHRVLADYRLPGSGSGDGRMALTRSFAETGGDESAPRAALTSAELACRLVEDHAEAPASPEAESSQ